MKALLLVVILSMPLTACGSGAKSPKFSKLPVRSKLTSVFMKCKNGDLTKVCKNVCQKFNRKNECTEEGQPVELTVKEAFEGNYILMHQSEWFKLLGI